MEPCRGQDTGDEASLQAGTVAHIQTHRQESEISKVWDSQRGLQIGNCLIIICVESNIRMTVNK